MTLTKVDFRKETAEAKINRYWVSCLQNRLLTSGQLEYLFTEWGRNLLVEKALKAIFGELQA